MRQGLPHFFHVLCVAQHRLNEGLDVFDAPDISFLEFELVCPRVVDLLKVRGNSDDRRLVRVNISFRL